MWPPPPRTVLAAAAIVVVLLSVAFPIYYFNNRNSFGQLQALPAITIFLPAAMGVLLLQAIPYPSVARRLLASAFVFAVGFLATVVPFVVIGCGFYGACNTR